MVLAVVLGSAAGGGFPQWNSNAPACRRARRGDPAARVRSQASLAVSSNNQDWFVLNATPDLRLQIEAVPHLHPRTGLRSSPITGVVLTGGDVDAIAGLLHLRERHRFDVYAPSRVLAIIAANPIFDVLAPDCVRRREAARTNGGRPRERRTTGSRAGGEPRKGNVVGVCWRFRAENECPWQVTTASLEPASPVRAGVVRHDLRSGPAGNRRRSPERRSEARSPGATWDLGPASWPRTPRGDGATHRQSRTKASPSTQVRPGLG